MSKKIYLRKKLCTSFVDKKVETIIKWQRPLAQVLTEELPRLWAATLEGRLAWGDPLNWVGQIAHAAKDGAVTSQLQAEQAAALL